MAVSVAMKSWWRPSTLKYWTQSHKTQLSSSQTSVSHSQKTQIFSYILDDLFYVIYFAFHFCFCLMILVPETPYYVSVRATSWFSTTGEAQKVIAFTVEGS